MIDRVARKEINLMTKNESSDEKEDELENEVFDMKCYIL